MAITIDWLTKVINVPKADLTLIQSSPEIRELDLNWFRLELKALEESEEGMPFVDTHSHNTEVTLSGLVYARIVEIINGYTVEFEDGQYSVNCVGANHNLADVKVANQVSLIVNNAAGLITNAQIEYSSFQGGVWVDVANGVSGTVFPRGTQQLPVDNLADALLIANVRGFNTLYVQGDITFGATDNIDGLSIIGQSPAFTTITLQSGASTQNTEFYEATIEGTLGGDAIVTDCVVGDITYVSGKLLHSILIGTIVLAGTSTVMIIHCFDGIAGDTLPILDYGGSGRELVISQHSGGIEIINKTGPETVSIDLMSGAITLDSTVTDGIIYVRGVGTLDDQSTGTTVVDSTALINQKLLVDGVFDESVFSHLSAGSFGETIMRLLGIGGENVQWSNLAFDANDNMTQATITVFTDNTLVTPRKSWTIAASYDAQSRLTSYEMKEV